MRFFPCPAATILLPFTAVVTVVLICASHDFPLVLSASEFLCPAEEKRLSNIIADVRLDFMKEGGAREHH
jgi:hypothetical protein